MSGKPNNAYDIVIKVTDDGENNEAGYAYSLDGGNTFSEEMTVPLNGEAVLANTGLTAKFTEAAGGDSFKEGDTFSFSTTAPSMSNADVISAVESLITLWVHPQELCGLPLQALPTTSSQSTRDLFSLCVRRG